MRAACAATGAAIAGIFIATIAMNAMRLYNAVRPVEFCIVPLCIILAALNMAGGVKSNAEDARRKGEGAGCREVVADRVLLMCALACTMCADIFMVLLGGFYPLSLSFFAAPAAVLRAHTTLQAQQKIHGGSLKRARGCKRCTVRCRGVHHAGERAVGRHCRILFYKPYF